jgi:assimilatory nitrate reductase catalytic subunit
MGCNLAVSAPDANAVIERLKKLDLLVVADLFLSETAELADIVLPVTQWAEQDGTMTNLEGRVLLRRRAKAPPPEVWTDVQILKGIADRLGSGRHFVADIHAIAAEFRRASAGGQADYAGLPLERVAQDEHLFWPCPSDAHPGTPRVFLDTFATDDGRARFHPVGYLAPAEHPDQDFPYVLTTGRILSQYQSGTQTRRIPSLNAMDPDPFVEIHPETARGLRIADNDLVVVTSRRGRAVLKARLSRDVRFDTLFVPFHWSQSGCANLLTHGALDPISRIPEFKVCAVRVEKAPTLTQPETKPATAAYLH